MYSWSPPLSKTHRDRGTQNPDRVGGLIAKRWQATALQKGLDLLAFRSGGAGRRGGSLEKNRGGGVGKTDRLGQRLPPARATASAVLENVTGGRRVDRLDLETGHPPTEFFACHKGALRPQGDNCRPDPAGQQAVRSPFFCAGVVGDRDAGEQFGLGFVGRKDGYELQQLVGQRAGRAGFRTTGMCRWAAISAAACTVGNGVSSCITSTWAKAIAAWAFRTSAGLRLPFAPEATAMLFCPFCGDEYQRHTGGMLCREGRG